MVKIIPCVFNIDEDIYLCASYIWCENSPVYNTINIDLFELLEDDISYFSVLNKIFITCDLNSRVGNKCNFIVSDSINIMYDDTDYFPDQFSARAQLII